MSYFISSLLAILYLQYIRAQDAAIIPNEYTFFSRQLPSVNGSFPQLDCNNHNDGDNGDSFVCEDPSSSVLSDGAVPRLAFFDANWARHFATVWSTDGSVEILFDLRDQSNGESRREIGGVEVVLFNCPRWGIGVERVALMESEGQRQAEDRIVIAEKSGAEESCDSLVKVCILAELALSSYVLRFSLAPNATWVHVAEVTFLPPGRRDICQEMVPPTTEPPLSTKPISTPSTTTTTTTTPGPQTCPRCDLCTPPNSDTQRLILSAIVSAIVTALFVGAIAISIQILICKCHPRLKAKKPNREDVVVSIGDQPFVTSARQHTRAETLSGSTNSSAPIGEFQSETHGTDYENRSVFTAAVNPLSTSTGVSAPGQRESVFPVGVAAEYEILSSGSYVNAAEEGRREYEVIQEPAGARNVQLFRNKAYGVNLSS